MKRGTETKKVEGKIEETNVAAVLEGENFLRKFTFKNVPLPVIQKYEVLLRIHTVGICGSDVHYWSHGRCGPFLVSGPLVLGHETSAIVAEVGEDVHHLKVGDRVAIEPGIPCKNCHACLSGVYNLCPDISFHATPPYDGTLTNFVSHLGSFCYKLPDNISFEEGALMEPLSVGVHACRRAAVRPGSTVFITGCGPIGLVTLLVAKASGATKILVADVMESRLSIAKSLGADEAFLATDEEILAKIAAHAPVTHTFECSGSDQAITLAIRATSPNGKIISIGRGAKPMQTIPLFELADKEITLLGSFRYADCYPTAIALVATGKVNVKPLVTHHYTLKEVQEAFLTAESGRDGAIKVAIKVAND